jgi:hypothetical protein
MNQEKLKEIVKKYTQEVQNIFSINYIIKIIDADNILANSLISLIHHIETEIQNINATLHQLENLETALGFLVSALTNQVNEITNNVIFNELTFNDIKILFGTVKEQVDCTIRNFKSEIDFLGYNQDSNEKSIETNLNKNISSGKKRKIDEDNLAEPLLPKDNSASSIKVNQNKSTNTHKKMKINKDNHAENQFSEGIIKEHKKKFYGKRDYFRNKINTIFQIIKTEFNLDLQDALTKSLNYFEIIADDALYLTNILLHTTNPSNTNMSVKQEDVDNIDHKVTKLLKIYDSNIKVAIGTIILHLKNSFSKEDQERFYKIKWLKKNILSPEIDINKNISWKSLDISSETLPSENLLLEKFNTLGSSKENAENESSDDLISVSDDENDNLNFEENTSNNQESATESKTDCNNAGKQHGKLSLEEENSSEETNSNNQESTTENKINLVTDETLQTLYSWLDFLKSIYAHNEVIESINKEITRKEEINTHNYINFMKDIITKGLFVAIENLVLSEKNANYEHRVSRSSKEFELAQLDMEYKTDFDFQKSAPAYMQFLGIDNSAIHNLEPDNGLFGFVAS